MKQSATDWSCSLAEDKEQPQLHGAAGVANSAQSLPTGLIQNLQVQDAMRRLTDQQP